MEAIASTTVREIREAVIQHDCDCDVPHRYVELPQRNRHERICLYGSTENGHINDQVSELGALTMFHREYQQTFFDERLEQRFRSTNCPSRPATNYDDFEEVFPATTEYPSLDRIYFPIPEWYPEDATDPDLLSQIPTPFCFVPESPDTSSKFALPGWKLENAQRRASENLYYSTPGRGLHRQIKLNALAYLSFLHVGDVDHTFYQACVRAYLFYLEERAYGNGNRVLKWMTDIIQKRDFGPFGDMWRDQGWFKQEDVPGLAASEDSFFFPRIWHDDLILAPAQNVTEFINYHLAWYCDRLFFHYAVYNFSGVNVAISHSYNGVELPMLFDLRRFRNQFVLRLHVDHPVRVASRYISNFAFGRLLGPCDELMTYVANDMWTYWSLDLPDLFAPLSPAASLQHSFLFLYEYACYQMGIDRPNLSLWDQFDPQSINHKDDVLACYTFAYRRAFTDMIESLEEQRRLGLIVPVDHILCWDIPGDYAPTTSFYKFLSAYILICFVNGRSFPFHLADVPNWILQNLKSYDNSGVYFSLQGDRGIVVLQDPKPFLLAGIKISRVGVIWSSRVFTTPDGRTLRGYEISFPSNWVNDLRRACFTGCHRRLRLGPLQVYESQPQGF